MAGQIDGNIVSEMVLHTLSVTRAMVQFADQNDSHVRDNTEGVGYQVFLRALHKYAKAQMRFGR